MRFQVLQLSLIFVTVSGFIHTRDGEAEAPEQDSLTIGEFLTDQGERLDCYFTFETLTAIKGEIGTLNKVGSFDLIGLKSVEELAVFLRRSLADVDVTVRKSEPPVIHLKDARLAGAAGYPLDQKLAVAHEGRLYDLGHVIHEKVPTFDTQEMYGIGETTNDQKTKIKFNGDDTIRNLLTDAVPLKGYSRILWKTQTIKTPMGEWQTRVKYYGQKNPVIDDQDLPK